MNAKQLFDAGKVRDAERQLTAYLRDHPTDVGQRTFLFELLCFAGDYSRAGKQLTALSQGSHEAELGAILYFAALHAEKTRHQMFETEQFPRQAAGASPPGMLNGRPFQSLTDSDPDLGARLEVFAGGSYLWIAFEHLSAIEMGPPQKLRDTLWRPAVVRAAPSFKGAELGEVLIPALYPFSWKHPDEQVWLGRMTDWATDDEGKQYPSGQKMWLVDGEEVPFLEVRSVEFSVQQSANAASS
ncbi:MAG: type VI secretion system accessory protein TagJ [Candidatus Korobacteraceae bacterium]